MANDFPILKLRPGSPEFMDLPWGLPLREWPGQSTRLVELPRGVSRHPVVYVIYDGISFALKELTWGMAESEYELLLEMEIENLPVVTPVGFACIDTNQGRHSVLITRYLDRSLPYRLLFMSQSLQLYRQHLLDAMAGLIVQLHLAGVYWGDCSLSNTLFRRDAGALQAYLVDAETVEYYPDRLPPTLRFHDLEIMDENVNGELRELRMEGLLPPGAHGVPSVELGAYIRLRYQELWEEITREELINPGENYRIQERIRSLNAMGFSVGDVQLAPMEGGDQLRFRVVVSDRNFHRDQLYNLTGLDAEEMQARKMVNEILEVRATLARDHNRSTPLSVAAYHWLRNVYQPVVEQLRHLTTQDKTEAELYCQVLEHKWYLSERAQHDVGHQVATEDYLQHFGVSREQAV